MDREDPEEELYSTIFTSLKHPIRRRILRMLDRKPATYSAILNELSIDSGHMNYHLDQLGSLVTKNDKYSLSTFGKVALNLLRDVEEPLPQAVGGGVGLQSRIIGLLMVLLLASSVFGGMSLHYYGKTNELTVQLEQYADEAGELRARQEYLNATNEALKNELALLSRRLGSVRDKVKDQVIFVPGDYSTIQSAVNHASASCTIIVGDGTYRENIVIDKPLTIESENGAEKSIVEVSWLESENVFDVKANNVTIDGFTIKGEGKAGICLQGNHCVLKNNILRSRSIHLVRSNNNLIMNNTVTTFQLGYDGIYLWLSSNNTIVTNFVYRNDLCGISLHQSSYNLVSDNTVKMNLMGIFLANQSNGNLILNNQVLLSEVEGISLAPEICTCCSGCSENIVANNSVYQNYEGIYLMNSSTNAILNNQVYNNVYGIVLWHSANNTVKGNKVFDNSCNFMIDGTKLSSYP